MERNRSTLVASVLLALALAPIGCGGGDPDPQEVLDRALTRANLAGLVSAPGGGTVDVEALGYEDRVLQSRRVGASPSVMASIGDALGSSGAGLRDLVEDPRFEGTEELGGVTVDHVSGELGEEGLSRALEDAGGERVAGLAGIQNDGPLSDSLAGAEFDIYVGEDDGVIRQLDLTLALDDPDNALPPARIRFSLTPGSEIPPTE